MKPIYPIFSLLLLAAAPAHAVVVDQFSCTTVYVDQQDKETINHSLISVPRTPYPDFVTGYEMSRGSAVQDLSSEIIGKWKVETRIALDYSFAVDRKNQRAQQYACLSGLITLHVDGAILNFRLYCPQGKASEHPFSPNSNWQHAPIDPRTGTPMFTASINTIHFHSDEGGAVIGLKNARASCLFVKTIE